MARVLGCLAVLCVLNAGVAHAQDVTPEKKAEAKAHVAAGLQAERNGKFADAVDSYTKALSADPGLPEAYDLRGNAHFKLGKFKESVADFDKFVELRPKEANGHWRRGISLYYAGKYADGKKQFEGYEKVDTNDVENAVWHFLCAAKADGLDKARAGILKIGKDERVPMMQVYELYQGKIKPEDVLKAAEAVKDEKRREGALFYAHLYLGIYADVQGDPKKALHHLDLAADKYRSAQTINAYMGEVARVHRDVLKNPPK